MVFEKFLNAFFSRVLLVIIALILGGVAWNYVGSFLAAILASLSVGIPGWLYLRDKFYPL